MVSTMHFGDMSFPWSSLLVEKEDEKSVSPAFTGLVHKNSFFPTKVNNILSFILWKNNNIINLFYLDFSRIAYSTFWAWPNTKTGYLSAQNFLCQVVLEGILWQVFLRTISSLFFKKWVIIFCLFSLHLKVFCCKAKYWQTT